MFVQTDEEELNKNSQKTIFVELSSLDDEIMSIMRNGLSFRLFSNVA